MRVFWMCGLLAGICWTGAAQPFRTPSGMLWAGSTFSLRAVATTSNGQPLNLSNPATVTVGAVIRWRVVLESEPALTVPDSEGWFTLLIQNRSNAMDALNIRLKTFESADASPWNIALFEQREDGSGFSSGALLSNSTSLLMPGESRRLYLRARPPSNRNTDGAWINWIGLSQRAPSVKYSYDFACGVEAAHRVHTSTSTAPSHRIIGHPRLIGGRLHWLTWDGLHLRLYLTPNPLSVNTTFSNNTQFVARIPMPEPTHQTVLIGDRWYLLTREGQIVFFLLSDTQNATTLPAQSLNLPSGVVPAPHLPLVECIGRLCFADTQNRIWAYDAATERFIPLFAFSTQPITHFSVLNNSLLVVGRADGQVDIYAGTIPVVQNLRVPGAGSQPVHFVALHQDILTLAVGNTLAIYHAASAKWLWVRTLDSAIIAPPVLDTRGKLACYALTENGWLYGFGLPGGEPMALYPRRLFETPIRRAALSCLTRADREVPYLYLQAELVDNTVRTLFITATNPLNRFVNPTELVNTPIGGQWLFTGNTDQDLAIQWVSWGVGSDGNRGAFYAFRLR
ncbi:MAG: hypothetical protein ACUVV1_09170 [Fimbriimonadales bacterium]